MCEIINRRKSNKNVFIHFDNDDENFFGVKKIPIRDYNYAVRLCGRENPDFLFKVSKKTSERDIVESYNAVAF